MTASVAIALTVCVMVGDVIVAVAEIVDAAPAPKLPPPPAEKSHDDDDGDDEDGGASNDE